MTDGELYADINERNPEQVIDLLNAAKKEFPVIEQFPIHANYETTPAEMKRLAEKSVIKYHNAIAKWRKKWLGDQL